MSWINLGGLDADKRDWQLTQSFTGNLVKIENLVTALNFSNNLNFRGLIALNLGIDTFFQIQEIFSIPEQQLFLFQDFNIQEEKRLAVRNISKYTNNHQWTINTWVWSETINPYIPNIIIDSQPVEINENSLNQIEKLINNSSFTTYQDISQTVPIISGG